MAVKKVPFNVGILTISDQWALLVRPVTSQDIFVAASKNLHPDGLFSQDIFGIPGTPARYTKEGYIDIKVEIFHPLLYKCLISMKGLYADIMAGKSYAVFDDKLKDFVQCPASEGATGYAHFVKHWKDIAFVQTDSDQRKEKIRVIEKYKSQAMTARIYVLPAGYRDVEIDETGRVTSNEVNALYSALIAISNTITPALLKADISSYDAQRYRLQSTFNEIYEMMFGVLRGKNNLMMGKWAARAITDSTRNVLVSMDITSKRLEDPGAPDLNHVTVGLLQFMKATRPKFLHYLKNGFLAQVFTSSSAPALLTDRRTLMPVRVDVPSGVYDKWMSSQGLEKYINSYKERSIRDRPIMVAGQYYLGLIYRGPDSTFKLIHGIDELPADRKKEDCKPISLTDLFYIHCYEWASTIPMLVTRYPIVTNRSTFPAMAFLVSTVTSEERVPLDANWQPVTDKVALKFPIPGVASYDAESPHPSRLEAMNADFDGDTGSGTALLSTDALDEVKAAMDDKAFYVGPDGKFTAKLETATINYILANTTGH
jgi:hypothetical protein